MLGDIAIIFLIGLLEFFFWPLRQLGTYVFDPLVGNSVTWLNNSTGDLSLFINFSTLTSLILWVVAIESTILLFHVISWFFKRPT